jgi:DNA-binding transcriptional LysR family regulator
VRVAASPTLSECWLPDVLVALESRRERHLSVELVAANSAVVRRMVRDGAADLGLAALDPAASGDGLTETVVCEDELVVAVPPEHPWAAVEEIDPQELARTPIVRRDPGADSRRVFDAALGAVGVTPAPPLAEIGSTAAARAAALAERAPVLLSLKALGDDERALVARRVAGVRFTRRFALLHPGCLDDLAPPARALARALLERAPLATAAAPAAP